MKCFITFVLIVVLLPTNFVSDDKFIMTFDWCLMQRRNVSLLVIGLFQEPTGPSSTLTQSLSSIPEQQNGDSGRGEEILIRTIQ